MSKKTENTLLPQSPDSADISPKTPDPRAEKSGDYFSSANSSDGRIDRLGVHVAPLGPAGVDRGASPGPAGGAVSALDPGLHDPSGSLETISPTGRDRNKRGSAGADSTGDFVARGIHSPGGIPDRGSRSSADRRAPQRGGQHRVAALGERPRNDFGDRNTASQLGALSSAATGPVPAEEDKGKGKFASFSVASSSADAARIEASRRPDHAKSVDAGNASRKSSVSSVSFRSPRNPSLPQGNQKQMSGKRLRESSPAHERFEPHVAFDGLNLNEGTKVNIPSLTLTAKHKAYQSGKRGRTFMVGLDENDYSDYALRWLLDEMVTDGDEVVCVRVIEKEPRPVEREGYQREAQQLLDSTVSKNGGQKAISVVMEYAFGKLQSTFQRMIQIHQPVTLVVGTRGRSLGGLPGLLNSHNSFSKYCLQYSPIPVIVVRPTKQRLKKKEKRSHDPSRHSYAQMLAYTGGVHESDLDTSAMFEFEIRANSDEEAHQVAKALGLPSAFDPTIKQVDPSSLLSHRASSHSRRRSRSGEARASALASAASVSLSAASSAASADSGEEDESENDDEGEFEVMSGEQVLEHHKKEKLHAMEVNEAAALKQNVEELDEDEE